MRKHFIYTLWGIFATFVVSAMLAFFAIWNGWIGYMPDIEDLQNPISRFATQVYSSDGKVLGTWNLNKENRIVIPYKKMSPYLIKALVATEDERFYEHSGIDFRALGRAIVKRGLLGQTNAGGGSTITQQLAKQLYSEKASSTLERLLQKPIEWVIAIKLERYYTKQEILALYLNYFDFLHNAVGIKTAANTYLIRNRRILPSPRRLRSSVSARTLRSSTQCAIRSVPATEETWCSRRWRRRAIWIMLNTASIRQNRLRSISTVPTIRMVRLPTCVNICASI